MMGDLRALARYVFDAHRFAALEMLVLLQIGSESPPDLSVTAELATVLRQAPRGVLDGQAHEG